MADPESRLDAETVEAESRGLSYARGVEAYLADAEQFDTLMPHQLEVFQDLSDFFRDGATRGYIDLPTGTGKTVLFVELSKAIEAARLPGDRKPKLLVVAPTKDLVHQTLGRSGERGYGRFAPDLKVGSYFSDSTAKEKRDIEDFDVVVTTYLSLRKLSETDAFEPIPEGETLDINDEAIQDLVRRKGRRFVLTQAKKNLRPTGQMLLDNFDVIVFDEAHHSFGEKTSKIIRSLPEDRIAIGFSATPDASEKRQLSEFLPRKIHELEVHEAIEMGLLAPLVPIGIKSGIQIEGSNLYTDEGEFIDSRISYLASDEHRNDLIVKAAKAMAESKTGTIISCIAGSRAWHARYLAEQLRQSGVRSFAVHEGVPAEERQLVYRAYEQGKIDTLTFVGVLAEGWDSPRTKALINARPTRSEVFAKQRLGRVTRPTGTAYVIDILDEQDKKNPTITVADVLNRGDVSLGTVVGETESEAMLSEALRALGENVPLLDNLPSAYQTQKDRLSELSFLEKGKIVNEEGREFALPHSAVRSHQGVSAEILNRAAELQGVEPVTDLARRGTVMHVVYEIDQARRLLESLPRVRPDRYYVDENGERWISTKGLATLFGKRYPQATESVIREVMPIVESQLEWIPAKLPSERRATFTQPTHLRVLKLYREAEITISALDNVLRSYFSAHAAVDEAEASV